MQVDTNVSEGDVGRLQEGMDAYFTVDAYPGKRFHGTIAQIRNAATTVQNVVTYDAVIDVDNDQLELRPGHDGERDDHLRGAGRRARGARTRRFAFTRPTGRRRAKATGAGRGNASDESRADDARTVFIVRRATTRAPVAGARSGLTDGAVTEIVDGDLARGRRGRDRPKTAGARSAASVGEESRRWRRRRWWRTEDVLMGALIELDAVEKTYASGDAAVHALAASRSTSTQGEFVAIMGASRLGQVDAHEHPRLPRPADERRVPARRARGRRSCDARELADVRNRRARLRVPELQPPAAHDARSRTWSCRSSTRASPSTERHARARRRARARRPRRAHRPPPESALGRPAAARRDRARARRAARRSSSPTSRRATSTRRRSVERDGALPGARARTASRSSSSRTSPTSPSSRRASSS